MGYKMGLVDRRCDVSSGPGLGGAGPIGQCRLAVVMGTGQNADLRPEKNKKSSGPGCLGTRVISATLFCVEGV